jgi:primase-polymerase (primpol)-like protein
VDTNIYKIAGYPKCTPNFEEIPDELKRRHWAIWKARSRAGQPGKFDKAPQHPLTKKHLSTSEPETWATFEQARTAFDRGGWSGVGVLLTGDGLVGWDIDNASAVFASRPEVKAWVERVLLAGGYVETSPSGDGYRGFIRAQVPADAKKNGGNSLELYATGRFLTVTGCVVRAKGGA